LLSRELHDEVGEMLTALRMELRSLEELRTAPADQFRSHLEDANHLAEQSLRTLRDMAMGLRPSMLDDLGLGPSGRHGNSAKHAGIPVNVQLDGMPSPFRNHIDPWPRSWAPREAQFEGEPEPRDGCIDLRDDVPGVDRLSAKTGQSVDS
jgi:hypothetical protein